MDADARQKLFYTLVLAWFLAGLGLRFLAGGMLRGSLYDIVLVAVLASATFSTRTSGVLNPSPWPMTAECRDAKASSGTDIAVQQCRHSALAHGAEIIQGSCGR
ncbi:MAG: hypothetical protein IPH86_13700 [bacterium]|nr:hypothetical protein [bacterium]